MCGLFWHSCGRRRWQLDTRCALGGCTARFGRHRTECEGKRLRVRTQLIAVFLPEHPLVLHEATDLVGIEWATCGEFFNEFVVEYSRAIVLGKGVVSREYRLSPCPELRLGSEIRESSFGILDRSVGRGEGCGARVIEQRRGAYIAARYCGFCRQCDQQAATASTRTTHRRRGFQMPQPIHAVGRRCFVRKQVGLRPRRCREIEEVAVHPGPHPLHSSRRGPHRGIWHTHAPL